MCHDILAMLSVTTVQSLYCISGYLILFMLQGNCLHGMRQGTIPTCTKFESLSSMEGARTVQIHMLHLKGTLDFQTEPGSVEQHFENNSSLS